MKIMLRFLRRLGRDTSGAPIIVYALLLALIAGIAGFGMVILSDVLSQFYSDAGGAAPPMNMEMAMPAPRCIEVGSNCKAGR